MTSRDRRTLASLRAVWAAVSARRGQHVPVATIMAATGLGRSQTYSLLRRLEDAGYIRRTGTHAFAVVVPLLEVPHGSH